MRRLYRGWSYAILVPADLQAKYKVMDSTGAGDSFSAGLIKGLLEGWDLKKAISFGQTAARITCSKIGAAPAFPILREVEEAVAGNY